MKSSFNVFLEKKIPFYSLLILLFIGFYFLWTFDKNELHLAINRYHADSYDIFFKYITHLGDGIAFFILIIAVIILKKEYATSFIIAGLTTLIVAYILKHLIFEIYRPYYYLKNSLHLVEGVTMQIKHSFPSGHTTAAFSMGILSILHLKKASWQLLVLVLAVLTGMSRVYLSQHFLEDVIAGAILGTVIALVSYQLSLHYSFFKK